MRTAFLFGFLFLLVDFFTIAVALPLASESPLRAVKRDFIAQTGACLAPLSESGADAVLSTNRISAPGATRNEKIALARVVQQINNMTGTRNTALQGLRMRFNQSAYNARSGSVVGYSFQIGNHDIQMCRGRNAEIGSPGYVAHEIGHLVGNASGLYSGYKAGPLCNLSNYSHTNYSASSYRNEEFAESFAAFVTHPDLLQQNPGCQRALRYFQSQFPQNNAGSCRDRMSGQPQAPAPVPVRLAAAPPPPPVRQPAAPVEIEKSYHKFIPYQEKQKVPDSAPDKIQEVIVKVKLPQPAAQTGAFGPFLDYQFMPSTYASKVPDFVYTCDLTPGMAGCPSVGTGAK